MDSFDYIIVGSGTAGSLLAARLSESGATVCVLEAGPPDTNPYIRIPAGFMKTLFDPKVSWQFAIKPGPGTNNRQLTLAQGRTLGGSSAINGMVFNRGHSGDYNAWAQLGNRGWGYADILPYFKRIESRIAPGDKNNRAPAHAPRNDTVRGSTGPVTVTNPNWDHPLLHAFVKAADDDGIKYNPDYNGENFDGSGIYQNNIHRGRRVSTAHAYLHPALNKFRISVRTNARVREILFEGKRATGIAYTNFAELSPTATPTRITARKSVIICAGAINSPKLLQLSGIGPADLLASHGIATRHNLPGVGENLRDHYGARMVARVKNTDSINMRAKGPRLAWEIAKWALQKPSILGLGPAIAHAFGRSNPALDTPDFTIVFTPACFKQGYFGVLDDFPGLTCATYPQRPESKGTVRIASSDPAAPPIIDPNYLSDEADRRIIVAAMKTVQRLLRAPAMSQYVDGFLSPPNDPQTDADWLDFARSNAMTSYHVTGTCKMGPQTDPTAVVDDQLRVHGLENLHIVDASIMPRITSSNTCAPVMMIAEKAADILRGRPPLAAGI